MKRDYDVAELYRLRNEGLTYQELADMYGVSKQAMYDRIYRYVRRKSGHNRLRNKGYDINRIVYRGIYEHFKKNRDETVFSFASKIYGEKSSENFRSKIGSLIIGEHNAFLNVKHIKKICEVCGQPFEYVFEERKVKEE